MLGSTEISFEAEDHQFRTVEMYSLEIFSSSVQLHVHRVDDWVHIISHWVHLGLERKRAKELRVTKLIFLFLLG